MAREPGRRGRLPVKPPGERFALRYAHDYLVAPLPPPTYPIDVSGGIIAWGMLGNDQYGDCGEAGRLHYDMATAASSGQPVPAYTTQQAVAEYLSFTGGADTGVNLADFLLWLYRAGRIRGFAPVDHTDRAACDSAMTEFRGLYVGVNLTDDAESLFAAQKPWDIAAGERPDPSEGHCIVKVKADTATDTYVTWGAEQQATVAWTSACLDEAWVIWTEEDPQVRWAELRADLDALGGTAGPDPKDPAAPGGGGYSPGSG